MKYNFKTITIQDLLKLLEDGKLNLNPPYQRNDIWPLISKKRLIESIKMGLPLPSFFIHDLGNDQFDMVDGQQRTRSFIGFKKGIYPDLAKKMYGKDDEELFKNTLLSVCFISIKNEEQGKIEDFYYRVNKFGTKLNRPEIKRAEFASTPLQELIEKLADTENFKNLHLFSEKSEDRLNDLDFISELLTLIKYGITDKKLTADKFYKKEDLKDTELADVEEIFHIIIDYMNSLNAILPINKTRYRQKGDFYTLFSFIKKYINIIDIDILKYQYKLLVLFDNDIFPTNEKCWAFQEYSNNCVSQSNSKRAREERLVFFERVLQNKEESPLKKLENSGADENNEFETITDIIKFYQIEETPLRKIGDYYLIDIKILNNKIENIKFSEE